jgi:hypothetical protein
MSQSSFIKKLYPSNLGEAGMHDKYITVPKKADPPVFFGHPPKNLTFMDKKSGDLYIFPFSHAANGEYRLTQFGNYFNDKNAAVDDEIVIEKVVSPGSTKYVIDLLKNGVPAAYPNFTLQPDEVNEDAAEYYPEGSRQSVLVNKYERNTKAREKCIEHHGVICKACDFDFEDNYGEVGEGFIHVHHIVPVAEIGESYQVDPINDLIPVCPNCHAMIHKRKPPYSIDEIKEMLNQ